MQPPPAPRFSGTNAVLLFIGITVLMSLVWAQIQQAKQAGSKRLPALVTFPDFSRLSTETNSDSPEKKITVVQFASSRHSTAATMAAQHMADLQTSLDHIGDTSVRLVSIDLDETAFPALQEPTFVRALAPGVEPPPPLDSLLLVVDSSGIIRSARDAANPESVANLLQDIGLLVRENPTL